MADYRKYREQERCGRCGRLPVPHRSLCRTCLAKARSRQRRLNTTRVRGHCCSRCGRSKPWGDACRCRRGTTLTLSLPRELRGQLDAITMTERISAGHLIRQMIETYLADIGEAGTR